MSVGSMTRDMRKRNWPRGGLIAAGIILLLAAGIWGYRVLTAGQQQAVAPATPAVSAAASVKTAQVTSGPISAALSYSGDVKAAAQVSVLPKGSGRIERLSVDVGSKVKKGDVLAELDSASLKAAVSQAKANLAAAQAKYDSLQIGPRAEQIAQAQAAVDTAQARLDQVKKGANDSQRQAAQSAVAQASASLDSARANVRAAQATVDTLKAWPTQREWGAALAAVDTAKANVKAATEKLADVKAGPKPSEILTAQQAVDAAEAAYTLKKDALDQAKSSTPISTWGLVGSSVSQAQESLVAAQTARDAAVAAMALLRSRPLPWEMQAAQSNLDAANASLNAANAAVDQMKKGATPEDVTRAQAGVTAAQNSVAAAEAGLATAQANLKQVKDGATEEELRMSEAAVVQAEEGVKLASNPYRAPDYDAARAGVMLAQASLDSAQIALSEASVTSPVDGVVAERYQSEGQLVGPSAPILSIVSSEVEIALGVEEGQIGQVAEGQKAEITVAAYPGQAFPARVSSIAPTADAKSRTFQVKVRPVANDGRLRAGMFAQVRIVTVEKGAVTLVPREAIVAKGGATTAFVLKGDTVEARAVKTGLASGASVEVLSGLAPGEEVVVAGGTDLRDGDKVKKS